MGARPVQSQCDLAGRAEGRAELDRDGHTGDRVLVALKDVNVPLLDVSARDARVAGQVVDVQFDRGGAGVPHRARVAGPASGRGRVEAGDHGDLDSTRGALQRAQMTAWAGLLFDRRGEV